MLNVFNKVPMFDKSLTEKPWHLTENQINEFFQKGYLQIDKFFDPTAEIDPCLRDIENLVEDLANKLYNGKKIPDLCSEFDVFRRLTELEKYWPNATTIIHKISSIPNSFRHLWANHRILDVMQQLLGPDIDGHPIWNIRPKAPSKSTQNHDVPWHQDSGYLDASGDKTLMITSWIPLVDSTANNGCLQVLRGGHRKGVVAPHLGLWQNTWYIYMDNEKLEETLDVDAEKDIVTCEVPKGGLLLFSNMMPHRSLENFTDQIRWSLDLRWQAANMPIGYYGLKDSIALRRNGIDVVNPDWNSFEAVDRHAKMDKYEKIINTSARYSLYLLLPWQKYALQDALQSKTKLHN